MDWQTNNRPSPDRARTAVDDLPKVRELPGYDSERPCPECQARRQAAEEHQRREAVSPQQTMIVFGDADGTHVAKA